MQIGHVRKHVPSDAQVSRAVGGSNFPCDLQIEEVRDRRDAVADRLLGDVLGWIDAQDAKTLCLELLQHGAVIAGDLDDRGAGRQWGSFHHSFYEGAAVGLDGGRDASLPNVVRE